MINILKIQEKTVTYCVQSSAYFIPNLRHLSTFSEIHFHSLDSSSYYNFQECKPNNEKRYIAKVDFSIVLISFLFRLFSIINIYNKQYPLIRRTKIYISQTQLYFSYTLGLECLNPKFIIGVFINNGKIVYFNDKLHSRETHLFESKIRHQIFNEFP